MITIDDAAKALDVCAEDARALFTFLRAKKWIKARGREKRPLHNRYRNLRKCGRTLYEVPRGTAGLVARALRAIEDKKETR